MFDEQNAALRWIVLLPAIGVALNAVSGVLRRPLGRGGVIAICVGLPLASFGLAIREVYELTQLPQAERQFVDNLYTWISADPFHAELSLLLDPLSAVMLLIVTGVGALIHVYAVGYLDSDSREDRGRERFFLYLNGMLVSMLLLVLGDNLLVMGLGWQGAGLFSYLLTGFWYLEETDTRFAQKVFVIGRIGDLCVLLGVLLLFWSFASVGHPTVEFREMAEHVGELADRSLSLPGWLAFLPGAPEWKLLTVAGLLLLAGACVKSAQLPLLVWLPAAASGPIPGTALIQGASVVTAGAYLICRMSFVYNLAPGALASVAWVGALTAFLAATIAIVQRDVRQVLAYSTVSQLGLVFLALGVASYDAAIFQLTTHAFAKALLVLGAGSVMLAMHGEHDLGQMGGLRRRLPVTFWCCLIGAAALAGIPPASGFFSRDEVLVAAFLSNATPGNVWLYGISLITVGLTALYTFRMFFLMFAGESRASLEVRTHIQESSGWVRLPLIALGLLAAFGSIIGFPQVYGDLWSIPDSDSLAHFLTPVVASAESDAGQVTGFGLALLASAVGGAGVLVAAFFFVWRGELREPTRSALSPLHQLLLHGYGLDELYQRLIVRPLLGVSRFLLDERVERALDGLGTRAPSRLLFGVADRTRRVAQTGLLQSYLFVMLVGGLIVVAAVLGRS